MFDAKTPLFFNNAVILAATTAFLYCVSTAYYGGYLGSLRLDADVLDRNFHQVLYNGFLTSFPQLLVALIAYSAARVVYSHLFLPSLTDWLRKAATNRRRYVKAKHTWFGRRKAASAEKDAKQRAVNALLYAAVGFIFIVSLVYFEHQGQKYASEILKQIEARQPADAASIIRVKIEDQPKSLLYLGCGARNCAGIDLASRTIYYFAQSGHSYQYAPVTASPASAAASRTP